MAQAITPIKNTTETQRKESKEKKVSKNSISDFISSVASQFGIKKTDIWKRQFEDLEKWLQKKDFSVIMQKGAEDIVSWETMTVTIDSNPQWESRYYALLHECGHILANESAEFLEYNYPCYVYEADGRKMKSDAYKVSVVGEEIEAWKLGRNLGDITLNHFIDHNKFDKMMTECIMSYLYWATEEENDIDSA